MFNRYYSESFIIGGAVALPNWSGFNTELKEGKIINYYVFGIPALPQ